MSAHASSAPLSSRPFFGADAQSDHSFGSRILRFITAARQRKADAEILKHLSTNRTLQGTAFLVELERRLAGQ